MLVTREYREENGFDVVVCGGGPAGVAAAVAAARKGAKTLLLERGGCLGGFWTAGLLTWLIDTENRGGLLEEVLTRLDAEADGKRVPSPKRFTADTEKTKLLFEALCREAGVQVLYHTPVCGAVKQEGRITHVLTESKSGGIAYGGKYFIDTTGDGDLGCHAGASFALGNENGDTQPMSLVCHLGGIDYDAIAPFDSQRSKGTKPAMLKELAQAGLEPSYRAPLLAVLSKEMGTYALMANHQYGSALDAAVVSQATQAARQELHRLVDGLRSLGGIWKNVRITATADTIGVREGRRIRGLYTLTREDVYSGRQFPDGICTVTFGTDVHNPKPGAAFATNRYGGSHHTPYQIPLRCLISAEIPNLLMGGRCISGDFVAHASYRVAGPAFCTGEAAGRLAAYCAMHGHLPSDIKDTTQL